MSLKKLLSGSLILSFSKMAGRIVSFVLVPVLTFYLNPTELGIVSIVMSIQMGLSIVYNPGVISATMRLYYELDNKLKKMELIGTASLFFLIFPATISILIFIFGKEILNNLFENFSFYPYGFLALILTVLGSTHRMWDMLLRIQHKIKIIALITFLGVLINLLFSLLFVVVFEMKAIGRIYGMIIGTGFVYLISVSMLLNYSKFHYSFRVFKEIIFLGFPLIFGVLASGILNIGDRFLIGSILGLNEVGIYDVAYKIGSLSMFLAIGFQQMWTPNLYENMKNEKYTEITREIKLYVFLISLICTILLLFIPEFYLALINIKYHEGIFLAPIISMGIFSLMITTLMNSLLSYEKKFASTSLLMVIAAISNIVLNIFFLQILGLMGAAIATLVAYLIYFILAYYSARVLMNRFVNYKIFLLPFIIITIAAVQVYILPINYNIYYIIIKTLFIISIIIVFFFSKLVNKEDKNVVVSKVKDMLKIK
jgi:O-antigen/teichoic acid export membrane protein